MAQGVFFQILLAFTFYSHHFHLSLYNISITQHLKHPLKSFCPYHLHYKIFVHPLLINHTSPPFFNLNPIHTPSLFPFSPLWSGFSPPLVSSDNNCVSEVMALPYLGQFSPLHQNQERSVSCFLLSLVPMGYSLPSLLFLIIQLYLSI